MAESKALVWDQEGERTFERYNNTKNETRGIFI